MCGIVGLIHPNKDNLSSIIQKMLSKIKHRGPDGNGVFEYSRVGIGQSRLAIIDLEGGQQPMSDESGKHWITYNGELYNYLELKEQLRKKGFVFLTNSDTEVVIQSYACWGKDCVNYFRGMFAFCILDTESKELFLARDHFGIKPLVYSESNRGFAFASEIQALQDLDFVDFDLDFQALQQYLLYQFIPAPKTIYKGIKKLKPGHFLRVNFEGKIIEEKHYWSFQFKPDYSQKPAYWEERIKDAINESVKTHLVSDVPFGAFLSGGVDSSLVVGNMAKLMDRPVKTFSIGFEEEGFSELSYARKVAEHWGTSHHEAIVKPDALGILPELVKHYGEPFGDSSAIPTYYVSQLAAKEVKVVLSGDGGDELFAGYESYTNRWSRQINPIPEHLSRGKKVGYRIANGLRPNQFPLRTTNFEDWQKHLLYFPKPDLNKLWKEDYQSQLSSADDFYRELWESSNHLTHFQKAQNSDFKTYLPYDILTKVDIASMMHSLEVRTPLLDIRVVEIASQIPEEININKQSGFWVGKQLLKDIVAKDLGTEFAYRKKMGFGVPISNWFGDEKKANGELTARLLDRGIGLDEIFNRNALETIAKGKNGGQQWLLVFLQEWMSTNK